MSTDVETALRRVIVDQQQIAATLKARGIMTGHVFCYTMGHKAGQGITEGGYNKAWRKARVAAGCPARIPHDFRRTAVRNLVRAGVPERVAMQLTGHQTRAVFERYNIVSAGDLRDAARPRYLRRQRGVLIEAATPALPSSRIRSVVRAG